MECARQVRQVEWQKNDHKRSAVLTFTRFFSNDLPANQRSPIHNRHQFPITRFVKQTTRCQSGTAMRNMQTELAIKLSTLDVRETQKMRIMGWSSALPKKGVQSALTHHLGLAIGHEIVEQ